ncbi:hypothetical protein PUR59_23670 [Streptomyces sp. SP18ES09]|uniref:hypothetical protein n=1 Tax=Streptomyces sp. SP18ES09 TaxID=3002532 RepID=UPI002E780D93|nr:hypothetical protein [Streptomyces sp. SP18ES09]MEE1818007.1 hypothetical protein [Streptomyces sp. SP18ES09]
MNDSVPTNYPSDSAPMDAQRLDEILDRANTATKGPWCTDSWEIYQGTEYVPGISFWIGETCRGTSDLEQDRADAAFVAAARTDVPELVAEVQRLRAERHSTNEALDDAVKALRVQQDRIAELEARLGRDAEQRHLMDPLDHALEALAPRNFPALPQQLDRRAL